MDFAITKGPQYSAAGEPFAHAWTPDRKIGVRHANDKTIEVFVDFDGGREGGSLGFITSFHDRISGELQGVSVTDCEGNKLSTVWFASYQKALEFCASFLESHYANHGITAKGRVS